MQKEEKMTNQSKLLTRIQLINWHYFENECVGLNGSTLISGENTAGKSTILDAIQLILTTNTRRFNTAANEKGKRDLKGYVRCKVGNVGEVYARKNTVISNVALEFYEEKTERYFVLGVHMTSADEESSVVAKWYVEECRLEALNFVLGNKPTLADEFRNEGRKVKFIQQKNAAKDRFKRRMGNLEDKFFDIIPKSLAFKPMDNVKEFINKFVLSEEKIDVESLRTNIETLSELESIIERANKELAALSGIVGKYETVCKKDKDILVNEFLLAEANIDALTKEITDMQNESSQKQQYVEANKQEIEKLETRLRDIKSQIVELNVAYKNNEANGLVSENQRKVERLEASIRSTTNEKKRLEDSLEKLKIFLRILSEMQLHVLDKEELEKLKGDFPVEDKIKILQALDNFKEKEITDLEMRRAEMRASLNKIDKEIEALQQKLRNLEQRKLEYPWYTQSLKTEIETEFAKRSIKSKVYIVAELLEITDEKWRNAIEGYFHTQKFYLIVEPEHYDLALEVYHRNRKKIHTAGIVNTKKIKLEYQCNNQSLAYVIRSDNRYAKAYANYILGRVIRCENIHDLENHQVAMTTDCMLYQGYVVRNLRTEDYKNPYIGQHAYKEQILNVKQELEEKSGERQAQRIESEKYTDLLEAERKVNVEIIKTYMQAPMRMRQETDELIEATRELAEAKKDPTLIELQAKLEKANNDEEKWGTEKEKLIKENTRLEEKIKRNTTDISDKTNTLNKNKSVLEEKAEHNVTAYAEAVEKYQVNRKTKSPSKIVENFSPQRAQLKNDREQLLTGKQGLMSAQADYNKEYDQDFLFGMEGIHDYYDVKQSLESVKLIQYEEKLKKSKEECEQVFKSDFLSKMKENIESARAEFKSLNKALQDIYYGEDSYHFRISYDRAKESLYRMIVSDNNQEGDNLWSQAFEQEYKEEMEELFQKLTAKDDHGNKVIEEYTDYRSYLDYDIEIHKKDGNIQKFSDIYGEKSGSETQVPYYVAIAASFYQLYRYGNVIRVMLLDEAFDKMDDERIISMMEFFKSLNLQVILATPPAKVEVIGENIDTILMAIRVGKNSIVEEYDF
jgi:hypothetical protein